MQSLFDVQLDQEVIDRYLRSSSSRAGKETATFLKISENDHHPTQTLNSVDLFSNFEPSVDLPVMDWLESQAPRTWPASVILTWRSWHASSPTMHTVRILQHHDLIQTIVEQATSSNDPSHEPC